MFVSVADAVDGFSLPISSVHLSGTSVGRCINVFILFFVYITLLVVVR